MMHNQTKNISPFGMLMPNRAIDADKYRFGFNDKENDNEVKGIGNQQDYGMRIYDGRINRFLSVDPLTMKYPELSTYQFASNKPIWAIDEDGLESYETNSGNKIEDYSKVNKPEDGTTCTESGKGYQEVYHAKENDWFPYFKIREAVVYGTSEARENATKPNRSDFQDWGDFSNTMQHFGPGLNKFADGMENSIWTGASLATAGVGGFSSLGWKSLGKLGLDAGIQFTGNYFADGDFGKAFNGINFTQSVLFGSGLNIGSVAVISSAHQISFGEGYKSIANGGVTLDKFAKQAAFGLGAGALGTGISKGIQAIPTFKAITMTTYMRTSLNMGDKVGFLIGMGVYKSPEISSGVVQSYFSNNKLIKYQ